MQHQSAAAGAAYRPGSRDDFDRLYQTAYPRVYRTLAAILADPAEAEDCAQDSFVQAFQAWARWQPTAPAEAGAAAQAGDQETGDHESGGDRGNSGGGDSGVD